MSARPTVVSLFSGAAGLDIGLERAGWETVVATDLDPLAVETLRSSQARRIRIPGNSRRSYLEGALIRQSDICQLSASDLRPRGVKQTWRPSLLTGGPPCQPWSSAGLQLGFNDARGLLIGQMLRLADELKPRFVLMENVRGLLTARGKRGEHGEAIRMIQQAWEKLGYAVSWSIINAADYGAAQRRIRLVLLATSDHSLPSFPEPTHDESGRCGRLQWVPLRSLLSGIPKPDESDVVRPKGARARALRALKPGTGLRTGGRVEHQRPGGHWGYRQDCFVADSSLPSRTIRAAATPDWLRLPGGSMRRLTWRECAALQGFPPDWEFTGGRDAKFRLIGNAVQTNVAEAIGRQLLAALAEGRTTTRAASAPWPSYFTKRIRGAAADHRANASARVRKAS